MDYPSRSQSVVAQADPEGADSANVDEFYTADIDRFEQSLLAGFDARIEDLLRIALHVYTVDRLTRRDQRSSWSYRPRDLKVAVPVGDLEFWRSSPVHNLIVALLEFLSDDHWDVRFRRLEAGHRNCNGYLGLEEQVDDVFLFSGGLDSVAGAAAHIAGSSSKQQLAVTVLHHSLPEDTCRNLLQPIQERFDRVIPWGRLRTSLANPGRFDQQETSQRCRAFLFVATGIAAALAKGSKRVLMFESGTGAVNAPLMAGMATGARTTKSSHPHFLYMMSELGSLMGQRRLSVELPYRLSTKGELVKGLADLGLSEVGVRSLSCAHLPRRSGRRQCGLCAACITRRQALAFAGMREPSEEYEYDIFARDLVDIPPENKLGDLKAVLGQVMDFSGIGPSLTLTPELRQWLLGTKIIQNEYQAKPWLEVLWRYRQEWLELAQTHRDAALPWAGWLIAESTEHYANASGF